MNAENPPRIISLFSGCGGMDLGFIGGFEYLGKYYESTEFKIVLANDIDRWACETYRENFGDHIVEEDISEVDFELLPDCDMVIGGFPCQDFSITRGNNREGITVKRGKLYQEFVGVVSAKKPKVIVAENVKGILSANKGMAIKVIASDFEKLGYIVKYHLWKFVEYGVPQKRERVILVGIKENIDFEYLQTKPTHKNSFVSSWEALKGVENALYNNEHLKESERTRRVIDAIPEGGNNQDTRDKNYYVRGMMSHIYRRLDRNKPSPTIIAGGGGGTWGYHYEEPRALTNRERARLQTFPDNFKFCGSTAEVRRQIGNAVPPIAAHVIANAVKPAFSAKTRTLEEIEEAKVNLGLYQQTEMPLMRTSIAD